MLQKPQEMCPSWWMILLFPDGGYRWDKGSTGANTGRKVAAIGAGIGSGDAGLVLARCCDDALAYAVECCRWNRAVYCSIRADNFCYFDFAFSAMRNIEFQKKLKKKLTVWRTTLLFVHRLLYTVRYYLNSHTDTRGENSKCTVLLLGLIQSLLRRTAKRRDLLWSRSKFDAILTGLDLTNFAQIVGLVGNCLGKTGVVFLILWKFSPPLFSRFFYRVDFLKKF